MCARFIDRCHSGMSLTYSVSKCLLTLFNIITFILELQNQCKKEDGPCSHNIILMGTGTSWSAHRRDYEVWALSSNSTVAKTLFRP